MTSGEVLRDARRRHGISQQRLATRARTTQSAISRIERDRVSPSVETLRELLFLLGEDLVLGSERRDAGIDRTLTQANLERDVTERLEYGVGHANFVIRNSPLPKTEGWA